MFNSWPCNWLNSMCKLQMWFFVDECSTNKCKNIVKHAPPALMARNMALFGTFPKFQAMRFIIYIYIYIYILYVCLYVFKPKQLQWKRSWFPNSIKFKCLPQWKKHMNSNVPAMVSVASDALNLYRLHLTSNMKKAAARVHTFFKAWCDV
jgi:hypothetical protein